MNQKITSKEPIEIDHKEGWNTLDEKYRMVCCLAYYIPTWQMAKEIVQTLMETKRWKAIDIMCGNLIKNPKYIYPSIFIEEPFPSQIQNKKHLFANEHYKRTKCKV
jgi:hypothetical protein